MTKDEMDRVMMEAYSKPSPLMILVAPKQAAMMRAAVAFEGRNHRRVKREMNKAWRRERKAEIARGIPPAGINRGPYDFWRNRALN